MGVGAADRMTCRYLAPPLADRISRREDAVVYRASLSNQAGALALRLWHKSDNFAHIRSKLQLENESTVGEQGRYQMTTVIQS
jgi:hypothetical protein